MELARCCPERTTGAEPFRSAPVARFVSLW